MDPFYILEMCKIKKTSENMKLQIKTLVYVDVG